MGQKVAKLNAHEDAKKKYILILLLKESNMKWFKKKQLSKNLLLFSTVSINTSMLYRNKLDMRQHLTEINK